MSGADHPIRVVVWGENVHEQEQQEVRDIYPDGMHTTIKEGIEENLGGRASVSAVTLQDPEHGLTEEVLRGTDVLVWWGHAAHGDVADEVVARIHRHVLAGMGLLVLHSGHWSKIFGKLMGTSCTLRWRSKNDREIVWTVDPTHPIAQGSRTPSSFRRRRCTASSSTCRRPTNSCSSRRSRVARSSAAA